MRIGNLEITDPRHGNSLINFVFLGDVLIWERVATPPEPTQDYFKEDYRNEEDYNT